MINKKGNRTSNLIIFIIFILVAAAIFVFGKVSLPPEFYSSFAGALAALIFSALVSYYFWQRATRQGRDTKAQIIQSLLNEMELNLNNMESFIRGCRGGTYFQAFGTAVMQRNLFWPRFLIDSPHPSFKLTQLFDSFYSNLYGVEWYATNIKSSLPEECRFTSMISPSDSPQVQNAIRGSWQKVFFQIQFGVKTAIKLYDEIIDNLNVEFKEYEFEKQQYFKENKTYEKLEQFTTVI